MFKHTKHIVTPAPSRRMTPAGRTAQRTQIDALTEALRLAILDHAAPSAQSAQAVNGALRRVNGLGVRIETQRNVAALINLNAAAARNAKTPNSAA